MSHVRPAFLTTISGVALLSACSTTPPADTSDTGGSSAQGTGGSSAQGTGGATGCPTDPPSIIELGSDLPYDTCTAAPSLVCTYDVPCESGTQSLRFHCAVPVGDDFTQMTKMWQLVEDPCTEPFDHCRVGAEGYHCDGTWKPYINYNPPPVCPASIPTDGDLCPTEDQFGSYIGGPPPEKCGYRCDDQSWTIATCDFSQQPWVYDVDECPD